MLLGLIACSTSTRLDVADLSLQESLAQKNEEQFIKQFPKDFDEFSELFAWDGEREEPGELYDEYEAYINYWYHLIAKEKFRDNEKYILSICQNAEWQPNGIDYFQDKAIAYIKEKDAFYLINNAEEKEAFRVLLFLFHSSGSVYDEEFGDQLNDRNKEMLKSLFISTESSVKMTVVETYSMDLDLDGVLDQVNVIQNSKLDDEYDKNHFGLTIQLMRGVDDRFEEWKRNENLIFSVGSNCVSEGFDGVVVEGDKLTIFQQGCYDYNILINSSVTFECVEGSVYLSNYREEYFNKADHDEEIPARNWTSNDFGILKFEDVSSELWHKLRGH